jgi:RHS repeat-associated protein
MNTMKTKHGTLMGLLVALATAGCVSPAQAFYDPSTQRWINRDPYREAGFEASRSQQSLLLVSEPHRYLFVVNNPVSKVDWLGLKEKDWESLIERAKAAFEEALKTATPGGEFVAALKVFGSCNSLGLALAWVKRHYDDCMIAAITGDPKKDSAAEKACEDNWGPKKKLLQDTYDSQCKKCEKK